MQEYVIDEIEKYLDEDKKNVPYATKEILDALWTMQQEETVILDI